MVTGLDPLEYYNEFPEKVFAVNENGDFVNKMDAVKTKLQNSQYWRKQYRKIGALVSICAIILLVTLLYETDIIQYVWDFVINLLGGLL